MNNNAGIESWVSKLLGRILITPYNVSLIVITGLWWLIGCYFAYSSKHNFDMIVSMESYIMYLSLLSIIIGMTYRDGHYRHLAKLGATGFILAVSGVATIKSTVTHNYGACIVVPLSMFWCLLLLKNIWLVTEVQDRKAEVKDE